MRNKFVLFMHIQVRNVEMFSNKCRKNVAPTSSSKSSCVKWSSYDFMWLRWKHPSSALCTSPHSQLLEFFLNAKLGSATAFLLTAVDGTRVKANIALPAYFLMAVIFSSQFLKSGLNDTTAKTEDKVKCRFLNVRQWVECKCRETRQNALLCIQCKF